ncbi:hypothetical protein D3C87_562420 [compost metagenome]
MFLNWWTGHRNKFFWPFLHDANVIPFIVLFKADIIPAGYFHPGIINFAVINIRSHDRSISIFPAFIGIDCFCCTIRIFHEELQKQSTRVAIKIMLISEAYTSFIPAVSEADTEYVGTIF